MNVDVNCPYCDAGMEICHDDGFGYKEGVLHQQECFKCGKTFTFETSIIFHYTEHKADCLNDGNHDYQPTTSFPEFCRKMRCSICHEEREPADEERKQYNIPTYQEYLAANHKTYGS
jgi:hypothetical protein